jgi:hypothetical protein
VPHVTCLSVCPFICHFYAISCLPLITSVAVLDGGSRCVTSSASLYLLGWGLESTRFCSLLEFNLHVTRYLFGVKNFRKELQTEKHVCGQYATLQVLRFKIGWRHGSKNFPKICEQPENSSHQKSDLKRVPYWGHRSITRHRERFRPRARDLHPWPGLPRCAYISSHFVVIMEVYEDGVRKHNTSFFSENR